MKDNETSLLSHDLATFAMSENLPDDVLGFASRALKNALACAHAASQASSMQSMAHMAVRNSSGADIPLVGQDATADPLWASWYNAAAANALDYDDTHIPSILHPTSCVAGAVLSAAITEGRNGNDLLGALAMGMEVACRLAHVISPQHYAAGWHITATCGVFGAAAGAGRLMHLDARQMEWAFGGAMSRASGFVSTLGTASKLLGVGGAARDGLLAAMLAAEGFDGPENPLGCRFGFLHVMGAADRISELTSDLGTRWHMLDTALKPYPCGVVLNPVIDAALLLRTRVGSDLDSIASIQVSGARLLKDRTDRPGVTTGNMAQVSAQHAVAVALTDGQATPAEFTDAMTARPDVQSIGAKVSVMVDDTHSVNGARIDVEMADGTFFSETVEHARGSLARPLGDADIDAKMRLCCTNPAEAEALIDACDGLQNAADLGALLAAMRRP
ncbi:MAG: MmgE/PrpD family protein [Sulfitobacter sp.]